jgi:malate dehydrogenase (oxaloacetate-decarboxylating)(NADP+)
MNRYKDRFIRDTDARTLADVMRDADVFVGCSVKGAVNKDMVCSAESDCFRDGQS